MRSEDFIGSRQEMADWIQPVIVDYLHELYRDRLGAGHASLRVLALSHGRLWRFLILDDEARLSGARKEVLGIARLSGLKSSSVDEIDQSMLTEIMDVIVTRFMRTPALARAYSHIALSAAGRLAVFGMAAA